MNNRRIVVAGAVTALAVIVFATTLARAVLYVPSGEVASSTLEAMAPARTALPSDLPQRLRIPTLSINATVQRVGIGKSGAMAVPTNFTDVAWYRLGTVPGVVGSAVMDGHVDNGLALAGVFKHLGEITVGDDVYVDTATSTLHFVVTDIENYPYKDVPLEKVFLQHDTARLNLITCEGAWVQGEKTYDHRLVVYTQLR